MRRALVIVLAVASASLVFGCTQIKKPVATPRAALQRIHFDFDSSAIKSEYEPVLRNNAQWMQEHRGAVVTIAGYCDERGSVEYNIALGDRRANSAKNYLMSLGVPASAMRTISYGEENPLCTQHNDSCWWQNRRDEFAAH